MAAGGSIVDLATLANSIIVLVLIVVGMFGTGMGGGMDPRVWFPWHPILMTLAFPTLMTLGRFTYLTNEVRSTERRRSDHKLVMVCATVAMLVGYLCIFMAHWPHKKFFGYDFKNHRFADYKRVAHAWLGYLLILMVLYQASSGLRKASLLKSMGKRVFMSHGNFGKTIIVLGGFNMILAIRFWAWRDAYKDGMYTVTVLSIIFGVLWPRPEKDAEESRLLPG